MRTHNIPFLNLKKENCSKLSQICNYGICSNGLKKEFETAVVNKPSVFEPLKFHCTWSFIIIYSYSLHADVFVSVNGKVKKKYHQYDEPYAYNSKTSD